MNSKKKILFNTEIALIITYAIILVACSIASPYFLTFGNLINICVYSAIMGIMSIGMTLVIISGGLDVSAGSLVALVGVISGLVVSNTDNALLGISAGLLTALACGGLNAVIITIGKINPLIATLGTMTIFRGLAYIFSGGVAIAIRNENFKILGQEYFLSVPNLVWIVIILYMIFWYILKFSIFGRKIYSVGGNAQASFLSGINIKKTRFIIYLLSALTSGISGVLLASQTGAGAPHAAQDTAMESISAVILGGTALSGGKGNIIGTFIGVLILATVSNGMILINIPSFYQMVFKGVILILAVLLDVIKGGGAYK